MIRSEDIKKVVEEAVAGTNFVLDPAWADQLEPHARCWWDKADSELTISISNPPGNAYREVDGEFFIALGCVHSDAVDWDGYYDNDDENFIMAVESEEHVTARIDEWVSAIETCIENL